MIRTGTRTAAVAALVLGVSGILLACKEGDPIGNVIGPATADFAEEAIPPGVADLYIALRKGAVNRGRIMLDVVVTEVNEPVTGIALKITYPKDFSKFVGCSDGEVFPDANPGAPDCLWAEPTPGSGEVFVARSIAAPGQATTVTGSRTIVGLEFLVFGVAPPEAVVFEGQNLGAGDASALLDANGDPIFVQWFSGELLGM